MPVSNIINKSSTINSSNISNSSSNLSDNHSITSSSSSSSSEEDSEEEEEEDLDFKVKKSLRKGSLLVSDTSRRNTRSSQERNKSSSASEKVVRVRKNSEKVELNLLSLSTSKSGKSKELSSSSKPKEVINKKNPRRNSSLTPTSTTSATTSNLLLEVKLEPISTSTTTRVSEASPSLPLLTTVLPKRSQQSPFPSHLNNLPMTIPIQSLISIPLHRQFSFIPSTSTTPASTNSTSSPLNPTSSSSSNALKCNTCNQSIELPIQVLDSLALKTSLWTLPSPIPSTNNKKRTRKELESEGKVEVVEETTLTPLERSELTSHRSKCGGIASIGTLLPSPSPPTPITTSTTAQPKSKKPKKGYVTILLPPSSPPTSTSTSTSPPPLSLNPLVPTKPIPFSRPSARKWYKSRRLTETLPATMNTRKVLYTNPVVIEKVWNGRSGVAVGVSSLMKVIIERGEKERISREKLVKGRKFLGMFLKRRIFLEGTNFFFV